MVMGKKPVLCVRKFQVVFKVYETDTKKNGFIGHV